MIVFKILLIAALVLPLIYIAVIMLHSVLDDILKDRINKK